MKLTRLAMEFLLLAVWTADYSRACDMQKLSQCSLKYLDLMKTATRENYIQLACRSDAIGYSRCILEEGKVCGTINQHLSYLNYPSVAELEKSCASFGYPTSKNAAEQILPTVVIIVGLLTALLV